MSMTGLDKRLAQYLPYLAVAEAIVEGLNKNTQCSPGIYMFSGDMIRAELIEHFVGKPKNYEEFDGRLMRYIAKMVEYSGPLEDNLHSVLLLAPAIRFFVEATGLKPRLEPIA